MPSVRLGDLTDQDTKYSSLDLGADPRNPAILDVVLRNSSSVRMTNAIRAAAGRRALPVNTVGQYADLGSAAPDLFMLHVPGFGRASADELDKLILAADRKARFLLLDEIFALLGRAVGRAPIAPNGRSMAEADGSLADVALVTAKREELCSVLAAPFVGMSTAELLRHAKSSRRLEHALERAGYFQRSAGRLLEDYCSGWDTFVTSHNFDSATLRELEELLGGAVAARWGALGLKAHDLEAASATLFEGRQLTQTEARSLWAALHQAICTAGEAVVELKDPGRTADDWDLDAVAACLESLEVPHALSARFCAALSNGDAPKSYDLRCIVETIEEKVASGCAPRLIEVAGQAPTNPADEQPASAASELAVRTTSVARSGSTAVRALPTAAIGVGPSKRGEMDMMDVSTHAWVRFLRSYGPIPSNDNMYDETIQRALRRTKLKPLAIPAQFVDELLANFASGDPRSFVLTGTAGDGKTYHCREVWIQLGGSDEAWNAGLKVQRLTIGARELFVVKDLSELTDDEGAQIVKQFASDVADPASGRVYLIAANHGQLLEKLKASSDHPRVRELTVAIESLMVTGRNPTPHLQFDLRDLSRSPASSLLINVLDEIVGHEAWGGCASCPSASQCPIQNNRSRMSGDLDGGLFKSRLAALVELSEHNGNHFPIRQLLVLATNMLLGHPDARDGLMSCAEVPKFIAEHTTDRASVYRNVFGENLKPSRAERTEPFAKLALFGIGGETSNAVDNILVFGADDPNLQASYQALMLVDDQYGATPAYQAAQRGYLEGRESGASEQFLHLLRAQRQRLFFTMPDSDDPEGGVWELTIFKFAGDFLKVVRALRSGSQLPRDSLARLVRGLNRVFSGMLVQTHDDLILATSGTHAQTRTSPLLDDTVSVTRKGGEEVALAKNEHGGMRLIVRFSRDDDPPRVELSLTPTRFEFLNRVAEGALPSSFSLECHEDFLAFKARLLSAADRRRAIDGSTDEDLLELRFLEVGADGRAASRRVSVRL